MASALTSFRSGRKTSPPRQSFAGLTVCPRKQGVAQPSAQPVGRTVVCLLLRTTLTIGSTRTTRTSTIALTAGSGSQGFHFGPLLLLKGFHCLTFLLLAGPHLLMAGCSIHATQCTLQYCNPALNAFSPNLF